jgi:hypothetical protein
MQFEVESPFDVTKNSFHQIEVGIPGRMHVEAGLLDYMGDIWTCMREVLESTCIAAVLGGISEKSTSFSGELAPNIDRCSAWITVKHAITLKKVDGILS